MSATSDNNRAWRRSSQQGPPRNNQREDSNPRSRDRDGGNNMVKKPVTSTGGSVGNPSSGAGAPWARAGQGARGPAGASGGQGNPQKSQERTQEKASASDQPELDKYIPVNDFNSVEVKKMLEEDANKALGALGDGARYKVSEEKSKNAWGRRPGQMASGQNFFTELSKQLAENAPKES